MSVMAWYAIAYVVGLLSSVAVILLGFRVGWRAGQGKETMLLDAPTPKIEQNSTG